MSVRTRSSARRGGSPNSSLAEEEHELLPPRPRRSGGASVASSVAPPPPPPPPRVIETPRKKKSGAPTTTCQAVQTDARPWKLMVRTEPTKANPRRDLVRMLVTPSMTPNVLSQCILQTCGIDTDFRDWIIAGLFRESDCLFVTLQDIIDDQDHRSVYTLQYPHFHIPQPQPWMTETMMILLGIGSIVGLWILGPLVISHLHSWSGTFFNLFVNMPIKELYRYGPSMIGWEGVSLAKICTRITYHGDEEFWKRNMEECQHIYNAKEDAMLRMMRPVLYLFTLLTGFWVARALVREHALSMRQKVKSPDRDMVETYQAFNVIFRQMSRAMKSNDRR